MAVSLSRPALSDNVTFAHFFRDADALAPGEFDWDEDDLEPDWETQDPADEELVDADDDMDWWLDDENDEESPLPDDCNEEDDENI